MATVINKGFRSLLAVVNLNQGRSCWMGLAEVSTKSTLARMQCDHKRLLSRLTAIIHLAFDGKFECKVVC